MELFDELMALVVALEESRVDYALCGGWAVNIHGHTRATTDIDLLLPEDQVAAARAAVQSLGFRLAALPMTFDAGTTRERRVERISKVEGDETLTLDLLIVGPPLAEAWETRQRFQLRGRTLCCVSLQGLASMKRLAGRHQDLADLTALGLIEE